jgi:hypothetical protein
LPIPAIHKAQPISQCLARMAIELPDPQAKTRIVSETSALCQCWLFARRLAVWQRRMPCQRTSRARIRRCRYCSVLFPATTAGLKDSQQAFADAAGAIAGAAGCR